MTGENQSSKTDETSLPLEAGDRARVRERPVFDRDGRSSRLRVERRTQVVHVVWYRLAGAFVGLVLALAAGPLYVEGSGTTFYRQLWSGTFGSAYGIESVLVIATPLMLASLAVAIPYRLGLWNIGGDGQMYIGAWMAAGIAFAFTDWSGALLIPVMLLGAMFGGGLWILLPAVARAYLGISEIITTLMLNFVGLYWLTYWASDRWTDVGSIGGVRSRFIPDQTLLGTVELFGVSIHWGFFIAVAVGCLAWAYFRFTRLGYEMSILRASESVGKYAGISTRYRLIQMLVIGGAFAGLAGAVEMMGTVHQYSAAISNNTGYLAIAVAILAAGSELGVIIISVLFAGVIVGSGVLVTTSVSFGVATGLFGVVLLCAAIGDSVARFRVTVDRSPLVSGQPAETGPPS